MNTSASKKKRSSSKLTYVSESPRTTRTLGALLARELRSKKGPIIIALTGDLGSGKTTFLKGFAQGLSIRKPVSSPTFLIARGYNLPQKTKGSLGKFYHVDAYRITRAEELRHIGWKHMISDPAHIVAIEWAERIPKRLLPALIEISFSHQTPKKRIITIRTKQL